MKKIIIVVAGKKGAGKNTIGNQIAALFENAMWRLDGAPESPYTVDEKDGKLRFNGKPITVEEGLADPNHTLDVCTIAFASPIKRFCVDVLGFDPEWVYGTDAQKNTLTHILWDTLPLKVRWQNAKRKWYDPSTWLRSGRMTSREVQQILGTEKMRAWIPDVWARAGYLAALKKKEKVVIITDGRFPNEIDARWEFDHQALILTVLTKRCPHKGDNHASERALEGYDEGNFDLVLPEDISFCEQFMHLGILLAKTVRLNPALEEAISDETFVAMRKAKVESDVVGV